jgi:transcriptional regulator of acetoin/glycerol metabolism
MVTSFVRTPSSEAWRSMDETELPPGVDRPGQAWDWMRQMSQAPTSFDWVRPEVAQAWERCLEDHALLPGRDLLRSASQTRSAGPNWSRELQSTLSVQTYHVHSFLQDADVTVLLTDTQGTLMHVVGAGPHHFLADTNLFQLGAAWSESLIGNNGISTAALLGVPAAFLGKEHFAAEFHATATAGYPIVGPDGTRLAVLGLLSSQRDSVKSLLAFLRMAGTLMEADVFKRHRPEGSLIRLRSVDAQGGLIAQQSAIDGLIVVADDERIRALNAPAMGLLGLDACSQIVGQPLECLLGIGLDCLASLQAKNMGPVEVATAASARLLLELSFAPAGANDQRGAADAVSSRAGTAPAHGAKPNRRARDPRPDTGNGRDAIVDSLLKKMVSLQERKIPILVIGESGVGKEHLVQLSHRAGPRRQGPLVAINCAAIPRELIESELFGYAGGSFTGAAKEGRAGKFQLANGGTLFLDEIGDMRLELQSSLLRVLESSEFVPVGGVSPIKVDVQVIAATNASLRDAVDRGSFRRDLYYRLNGAQIWIPSLRERPDKIQLINCLFEQELELGGFAGPAKVLSDEVIEVFLKHPWPGNIRQLRNVLKTVAFMSDNAVITEEDLPPDFLAERASAGTAGADAATSARDEAAPWRPRLAEAAAIGIPAADPPLAAFDAPDTLAAWEKQATLTALRECAWNVSRAAKRLEITRSTLYQKISKYGIKKPTRSW